MSWSLSHLPLVSVSTSEKKYSQPPREGRPRPNMNVLIIGAGASNAIGGLPTAFTALKAWQADILGNYRLLAFALEGWLGENWPNTNLEAAWTRIDLAWKERAAGAQGLEVPDLTHAQRQEVWRRAFEAAAAEAPGPAYYQTQIQGARDLGHSTEQFLSIAAGWELRRLIQEKFVLPVGDSGRKLYAEVLQQARPDAVISFNYDTLLEQCLPGDSWTYTAAELDRRRTPVLKPHGSVNWVHRHPRITGPAEEIEFQVTLQADAMGYHGNWLVQNAVIGLRAKIEHTPAESSPAIRTLFRGILNRCEEVLAVTDRVWIVGYRIAPADTGFLDVLARALAQRHAPPQVSVIGHGNPEDLLPHIRDVFALPAGLAVDRCFHGLEGGQLMGLTTEAEVA